MDIFITKYALSSGIVKAELVSSHGGMVEVKWEGGKNGTNYFHDKGVDWHETQEDAVRAAYAMRDKRVASLRKQIEKLNHLDFST